jgi:hypothetical protein
MTDGERLSLLDQLPTVLYRSQMMTLNEIVSYLRWSNNENEILLVRDGNWMNYNRHESFKMNMDRDFQRERCTMELHEKKWTLFYVWSLPILDTLSLLERHILIFITIWYVLKGHKMMICAAFEHLWMIWYMMVPGSFICSCGFIFGGKYWE